ncbi:hypothetical protein ACFWHT_14440 [Microbacterium sp. NPDC058342]|uniref:hypothetical protein n=1 Tax=Microbacterium sp. NPDC058342 TaxID=3346454 RepID=UPI0036585DF3
MPPVPAAPPGAYGVPVGGYLMPVGGYQVPPTERAPSKRTGALALVAALLAAVVAPIVGGVLALQIGLQVLIDDLILMSGDIAFSALSPVRTQVLWIEITFWAATVLGVAALVLGIVATARRRGRGMGITAIVLAVLGPAFFFFGASILFGVGNGIAYPQSL